MAELTPKQIEELKQMEAHMKQKQKVPFYKRFLSKAKQTEQTAKEYIEPAKRYAIEEYQYQLKQRAKQLKKKQRNIQVQSPKITIPQYQYGNLYHSQRSPHYQEASQFGKSVVPYRPVGKQQSYIPYKPVGRKK